MQERTLLRVSEAAERLSVGRTKAYELIKEGSMPGVVRVGQSVRVSAKHLDEWIDSQASQGANGDGHDPVP